MHSVSGDSVKIDNQDEVMTSTKDQPRDVEKPALTSKTSRQHGGNRVLSSWARSELIARANQDQLGSASCTSFYLFFSGTFLFTMAGTLLSTGVWCFLVRLPMIHMAPGPSRIIVVLSGYIFAAGALALPASCILYREHNVTRDRRTLLPMIIMLCLSIVFSICGATHGIVYRKSYHPLFQESATAQARLQCCGINEASDWTGYPDLPEPPSSCYFTSSDEDNKRSAWKTGCLEAIASDLAWITAYIVGLCFMSILAHILAIVSVGILLWTSRRTSGTNG